MKTKLTDKQKVVLDYIVGYVAKCKISPTQADIANNTFVKHQANVRHYLQALSRKKYISIEPFEPRSIQILPQGK